MVKNNKKKLIAGAVLVAIVVILVFVISSQQSSEKEKFKVGVMVPLSGDASQWGVPPKKGVKLAANESGLSEEKIEIIYEDTKCKPKEGVSSANKLVEVNDVDVIVGAVCSSVTLSAAPIAEKNEVPMVSPASTSPKITNAGDWIFRLIPTDSLRAKSFSNYIKNSKNINKVSILYIENDAGEGLKRSFKENFNSSGRKVVSIESYKQGSRDVRSQLTKIKEDSSEAIVVVSYPGETAIIMKQAEELGINKPLYFLTEAVENPEVLEAAGSSSENVTYILPSKAENKKAEKFRKKFKEKYNKKPELFAAEAYDAFNLLTKYYLECSSENKVNKCIKKKLYRTENYMGASGEITIDENGDVIKPMSIKKK